MNPHLEEADKAFKEMRRAGGGMKRCHVCDFCPDCALRFVEYNLAKYHAYYSLKEMEEDLVRWQQTLLAKEAELQAEKEEKKSAIGGGQ